MIIKKKKIFFNRFKIVLYCHKCSTYDLHCRAIFKNHKKCYPYNNKKSAKLLHPKIDSPYLLSKISFKVFPHSSGHSIPFFKDLLYKYWS